MTELTAGSQGGAEEELWYEEQLPPEEYPLWASVAIMIGAEIGMAAVGRAVSKGVKKYKVAKAKPAAAAGLVDDAADAVRALGPTEDVGKALAQIDAKQAEAAVDASKSVAKSAESTADDATRAATKALDQADEAAKAVTVADNAATKAATEAVDLVAKEAAEKAAAEAAEKAAKEAAEAAAKKAAEEAAQRLAARAAAKAAKAAAQTAKVGQVLAKAQAMGPLGVLDLLVSGIVLTLQNTVKDLDPSAYAPPDTGMWSYSEIPEPAKIVISSVPVIGSLLDLVGPLFQFGAGCPEGMVQDTPGGLCFKPCDPGYTSDGAFLCYKQYPDFEGNGQLHTLTSVTKNIQVDTGVPLSSCPDHQERVGALCYDKPREGFNCVLDTCYKGCPGGTVTTSDVDRVCWQDSFGRGVGRLPDVGPCDGGQRDDGTSCWEDWRCDTYCDGNWSWDDGGFCHTRCGGCGCIKKTLFDRQRCNPDEDLDGGICYPKCRAGYHGVGPVCWSDEGTRDRETYYRGAGDPMKCAAGQTEIAGLCYGEIPTGYSRQTVGLLSQNCPEGATDFGVGCSRASYSRPGQLGLSFGLKRLLPEEPLL